MENSMSIPQKLKNRTPILSRNFTSGYLIPSPQNLLIEKIYVSLWSEMLFTIAKIWKQSKLTYKWFDKEDVT